MAVTKDTVYIKGEQNVEVTKSEVTLGDILSIECANLEMIPKIKALKLLKVQNNGKHRYVVSVLKIIECIHRQYPNVDIENLGKEEIYTLDKGGGSYGDYICRGGIFHHGI